MEQRRPWMWWIALWVPLAMHAWRFWFLCDDSYITFRYARNLVHGYGIRYNLGEAPSEGYSNFLWLLLAAIPEALHLDTGVFVSVFSFGAAAALVAWVWKAQRDLGVSEQAATLSTLALVLFPPFGAWCTSGLETMSFAFFVFAVFERLVLAKRAAWWQVALLGAGLALSRTEGILWFGVILALGAAVRLRDTAPEDKPEWAAIGKAVGALFAVYAAYTAWRYWWFGSLISNTTLVKAHFGGESLSRGSKYFAMFLLTFVALPLPFVGAPALVRKAGLRGVAWLAMAVAFFAYGVLVGGDFMPMGRFFVPSFAFLFGTLGFWLDGALVTRPAPAYGLYGVLVVLGLLPGFDIHVVPQSVREGLHFRVTDREFLTEYGRWANMIENTDGFRLRGLAIKDYARPDDTMVGQAVGAIGYYSDLFVYDCYGLVTREVAELPVSVEAMENHSPGHDKEVPASYFAKDNPTYLHFRVVQGAKSVMLIKDSFNRWEVPDEVKDRYVPDFVETFLPGEDQRSFLVMVRLKRAGEDPATMWDEFEDRRIALGRELRAEAIGEEDDGGGDDAP